MRGALFLLAVLAAPNALAEQGTYSAPVTSALGRVDAYDFAHCAVDQLCFIVPPNVGFAVVQIADDSKAPVAVHWTLSAESGVSPAAQGDFCGSARIDVTHGRVLSLYVDDLLAARRTNCLTSTLHGNYSLDFQ